MVQSGVTLSIVVPSAGSRGALDGSRRLYEPDPTAKVTAPAVRARKVRTGADPLVMVTAYDAPGARMADEAGVDMILVGDSLAMVVLGYDDTLQVTDRRHGPPRRAPSPGPSPAALIVGDLPWMSYHVSRRGHRAQRRRADPGRRPGGEARGRRASGCRSIEAIVDAEIPVMGHLGPHARSRSTPWAASRCRAASTRPRSRWSTTPRRSPHAGCFAIVLEGVPDEVAAHGHRRRRRPDHRHRRRPRCDGQVLVYHDVLGIEDRIAPKFVRRYADLKAVGHCARSRRTGGTTCARGLPRRRGELPGQRRGAEVLRALARPGLVVSAGGEPGRRSARVQRSHTPCSTGSAVGPPAGPGPEGGARHAAYELDGHLRRRSRRGRRPGMGDPDRVADHGQGRQGPRPARLVGQAPLRLRDQPQARGLLRRVRARRRARAPRRPRALAPSRGRRRPPQADPPARRRGRPSRPARGGAPA